MSYDNNEMDTFDSEYSDYTDAPECDDSCGHGGAHGHGDSHGHEEGEEKRHRYGRRWSEDFEQRGHRGHGPHGEDDFDGPERWGRRGHGPHGEIGDSHPHMNPQEFLDEAYKSLDTEGKLNVLLHDLSHMSRFGMENRAGQNRIIQILAQEGDMTQRVLTSRLGIQPGSVSELLGKLERAGYITRRANQTDRRTTDIHLTEAGQEIFAENTKDNPALFSALNEEEQNQLLGLLEKLRADWRERFPRERREPHGRPMGRGGHGRRGRR